MVHTHYYGKYIKKINKLIIAALLVFIIVFNLFKFSQYAESTNDFIVIYNSPVDVLKDFRTPLLTEMYFNENYGAKKNLRLIVLPVDNRVLGTQALKSLLKKIKPYQDKKFLFAVNYNYAEFADEMVKKLNISAQKSENNEQIILQALNKDNNLIFIMFGEDDKALKIAGQLNLHPYVFNLNAKFPSLNGKIIKVENEIPDLEQQENNLRQFAADYKNQLTVFLSAVLDGKNDMPEYSAATEHMFDKGAAQVLAIDEKNEKYGQFGDVFADTAVARSFINGFLLAKNEMPDAEYKFFVLTKSVKKKYIDEQSFIEDLNAGVDGVMLVNGYRQAMFLPYFWKIYPDKKDFIKNLKVSAGLSPDYWSTKIKVYYFRAVEVEYEN